jgi:membrane peptidoglycan carboxypeptidase
MLRRRKATNSAARRNAHRSGNAGAASPRDREMLALLAVGFLVLGGLIGLGWQMDRQLRGGLLLQRAEAAKRTDWVPIGALPAFVPQAFVAAVDPDFGARGALDVGTEQPSLARELVRQVHELHGVVGRAKELIMAPLLEHELAPQPLLELYLNRVALGEENGWQVYGISSAAQEYFAKKPAQLTLSEAATLAGLLLEPRLVTPAALPGAAGIRRNEVLRQMLADRTITPEAYQAAIREPLAFQPGQRQAPMTRPLDWASEPAVLRLPDSLQPRPDSAAAASAR